MHWRYLLAATATLTLGASPLLQITRGDCGFPNAPVDCATANGTVNCHCVGYCKNDEVDPNNQPVTYTPASPCSYEITTTTGWCSRRTKCVNTAGTHGGPCGAAGFPPTCELQPGVWIYSGSMTVILGEGICPAWNEDECGDPD
jgi:hypothetical protein